MAMLSEHFSSEEFRCHDGSEHPIAPRLLVMLEALRAHFGRPVHITSGYRSPGYNQRIGGASRSRHVSGEAADIQVDGIAPAAVYAWCDRQFPVSGLGLYPRWVHIDCRDYRARWGAPAKATPAGARAFAAATDHESIGGVLVTSTRWTLVQGLLEIAFRWGVRAWQDRRVSPEGLLDLADDLLALVRRLQEEAAPVEAPRQ